MRKVEASKFELADLQIFLYSFWYVNGGSFQVFRDSIFGFRTTYDACVSWCFALVPADDFLFNT